MRNALLAALVVTALPAAAFAATPSVGVEQKLRRGLFVETDLGTYFDVAGGSASNAQAYLQLGIGYDVTDRITLAVQFGLGASSGVCLGAYDNKGQCGVVDSSGTLVNNEVLPDNFSNTFFQLNASYRIPLVERLALVPGIVVGGQLLDPAPLFTNDDPTTPNKGGFMAGADVSLEYATHLDHFFVGLDVEPRYLFGPNLFSMAIYPRVKYTF